MSGPPLAALLTPTGRGAIATIGVSVDWARWSQVDALPFHAVNGRPLSNQATGRIVFGRWGTDSAEDVVICPVAHDSLEIHCHGGDAADDPDHPHQRSPSVEDAGMGDLLRFDAARLRILLERHHLFTGSARARLLLEDWDTALLSFVKIVPRDFRRALLELAA